VPDTKHRSAVERFLGNSAPRHEPETEEAEVRDAYDGLRTPKSRGRAHITLDVRLKDGNRSGFSFAYLLRTDYVPGDTIRLHFAQAEIVIEGRRLSGLYSRLIEHRVEVIQEGTETEEGLKADDAAHIERITINDKHEEPA
jgi:hypothetical protein